ncbi:MAG: hypothetical protein IIA59_00470 [Candidatus Marinimicrobia bacterium]|nr:hypothetical protein [Candidatus Neomarinimicrobiota bacterium]
MLMGSRVGKHRLYAVLDEPVALVTYKINGLLAITVTSEPEGYAVRRTGANEALLALFPFHGGEAEIRAIGCARLELLAIIGQLYGQPFARVLGHHGLWEAVERSGVQKIYQLWRQPELLG